MFGRVKRLAEGWARNQILFNVSTQERLSRQTFFHNAFKAISFNKITGDYVEFGCWGCETFPLA